MSAIASGIGGIFNIGATLIGGQNARKLQAKQLKAEQQASVGSQKQLESFLIILAGGGAVLVIFFLLAKTTKAVV